MKILVAGKGFIGSRAGEKLEEKGHKVKYLDRKDADFEVDVTHDFEIKEEFDVLIHTIGLAPGFYTAKDYFRIHIGGTKRLVDNIEADKIVYLGALGTGKIDHSFFRTKMEAERIIKKSDMDYTILRPSTVYGEGNKLLEMMKKTAPTRIFPNIKTRTQPIHREDLAQIVSKVVEDHDNQVLDIAGSQRISLGNLGKHLYNEEGYKCLLIPIPMFLLKLGLTAFSFLPPPFQKENVQILENDNITENNDAGKIVDLKNIF